MNALELTAQVPSELSYEQWHRLVESIEQQLANNREFRLGTAIVSADDFTLEDYRQWFAEVAE